MLFMMNHAINRAEKKRATPTVTSKAKSKGHTS
jgi:hypothetical protein